MKYDIDIKAQDMQRMIRNNYISTLILLGVNNVDYLRELSNEEMAEQIVILRSVDKWT